MLSVVIPYYGASDENMRLHVQAMAESTLVPSEIIVVNDGHVNDLTSLLQELVTRFQIPICYVKIEEDILWNYETVNLGVWLCNSKYLSIEDCDFLPDPEYYQKGVAVLESGYDKFIAHYKNEPTMPAACGIYRRRMIAELGGWEEDFSGHYGFVDIWISAMIDRNGYKVFRTEEQLITKCNEGESWNVDRDNTRNQELLKKRLKGEVGESSVLRKRFTVKNFKI